MLLDVLILTVTLMFGSAWTAWLDRHTRSVVYPEFATMMSAFLLLVAGWLVLAAAAMAAVLAT